MPKHSFEEFKKRQELKDAYQAASLIQENFALSIAPQVGVNPANKKQNEGFVAVQDVIAKIDAMTRMFDNAIQENNLDPSSEKVSEIIIKLYELAAIKLNEAKKKAQDYMDRITGKPNKPQPTQEDGLAEPEEPDTEETGDQDLNPMNQDNEESEPGDKKFSFATRGPEMSSKPSEPGTREPGASFKSEPGANSSELRPRPDEIERKRIPDEF